MAKDLFSSAAEEYNRFRPGYPKALYQFIFSMVRGFDRAWDAGTGNGQVARVLSNHFKQVHATDISREQLREAPRLENVSFVPCPAERTPLPDNSIDLITAAQALHWFRLDAFSAEVRRVAAPEALLCAWGYQFPVLPRQMNPIFKAFHENLPWAPERELVNQAYRDIPLPFFLLESRLFSMNYHWTLPRLLGYIRSWSALNQLPAREKVRALRELEERLAGTSAAGGYIELEFPVFLRVYRVRDPSD